MTTRPKKKSQGGPGMEVTGITLFAAMGLQAALRGKPLNFRDFIGVISTSLSL